MPHIHCHPDDVDVAFEGEANLLQALLDADVPIAHLCGGRARCSTCRVHIAAGSELLSERTQKEVAMANRLDFPDEIRLACQTTARADVDLRRLVLDDDDLEMASQIGGHGLRGPIGKEVEMAVLFADVAGFTPMTEVLPPYDVLHMLNRFFSGAGRVVAANSGRVDNYIGDAVLALFGIENDDPTPAASAIRAGLGLLDVAANLNTYIHRIYQTNFAVRIGIDYGEAVYGLLGDEDTARETAIGDVVNVASRLQGANKQVGTQMLVSDSVFRACSKDVEFGRSFDLDLRGKVGRVTAHEVIAVGGGSGD